MSTHILLPTLYVEGADDISVINALLGRHGVETNQGNQYLQIKAQKNVETLLLNMPEAIRTASDRPVGFVLDIDIEITNRWNAVRSRLNEVEISPPVTCPPTGYFGQLRDYPYRFGIWLMPDCASDYLKMEHLCQSLMDKDDPLWSFAKASVTEAARLIDEANEKIVEVEKRWKRFHDVDRIKSEIHTWLAWQQRPGAPLGAAINAHILGHDSSQAIAFLRWLRELFEFSQLSTI
jgi:hypothetical protein